MHDLRELPPGQVERLVEDYTSRGFAALAAVRLPAGFRPPSAEIAFVHIEGTCEVWAAGQLAWEGQGSVNLALTTEHAATFLLADAGGLRPALQRLQLVFAHLSAPLADVDAVATELDGPESTPSVEMLAHVLQAAVVGQEEATRELALRTALHLGRDRRRRPLSVLAVGPTGVGKTRSAEVLAQALAELGYQLLRIDMNEYSERHRVSQLLGAPQGYAGFGEGAVLLDTLREQPRTLVLLDEIEKGHPAVLLTLMNAMDAGHLTSPTRKGGTHRVDCREAIFFLTSNLGAEQIAATDGATETRVRRLLVDAGLPPELIGRMASVLVFRPLPTRARIEAAALAVQRVGLDYGLEVVSVDTELLVQFMKEGSRAFGVRGDEHAIDRLLGAAFLHARQVGANGPVRVEAGPPPLVVAAASVPVLNDVVAPAEIAP